MDINTPYGLDTALIKLMQYYRGEDNALKKPAILYELSVKGWNVDERIFRKTVEQINNDQEHDFIICSGPKGYYMPATPAEVSEYNQRENLSRIRSLSRKSRAINEKRKRRWGEGVQVSLFEGGW